MLISVADINAARKFYEDLFGLEVYQDYGRNIAFTCGLALQQDFDGFLNKLREYPGIEYLGEVIEHSWGGFGCCLGYERGQGQLSQLLPVAPWSWTGWRKTYCW